MPPQNEFPSGNLRYRLRGKDQAEGEESEQKVFSWKDVAKHNTSESCWVAVRGKVYDITPWLDSHPGGKEILLLAAGRDITYAFDSYHPFTDKPTAVLAKFERGVVTDTEFPPYKPDSGFYKAACQRVGKYFKDNNIDPKDPIPGLWRMTLVAICATVTFLYTNGFYQTGLVGAIVAAAIFGVCQALPLLHVMHDSSHLAFGHTETWWKVAGRLAMDFYAGANMTSWHNQHVIGHHIYTNAFECDPDLPVKQSGDPRRLVPRQDYNWVYKYQYLYLPPLYGILGIKFRFQDLLETFGSKMNGPVRVNPHTFGAWFELVFTKVFWFSWRILLPLLHPAFNVSFGRFWALFFISEFMTGYFLAFNFQVSHVSTECDYPLGVDKSNTITDEWAVSQVKSSVDYSHGNWLTTFLCGALNYQVTHHLFPTVSQYHYPAIAPLIQEVCKEYKVDYKVLPDFTAAFNAHIKHLQNMGEKGIPAEIHMG